LANVAGIRYDKMKLSGKDRVKKRRGEVEELEETI
jgi:hypothetical protein